MVLIEWASACGGHRVGVCSSSDHCHPVNLCSLPLICARTDVDLSTLVTTGLSPFWTVAFTVR